MGKRLRDQLKTFGDECLAVRPARPAAYAFCQSQSRISSDCGIRRMGGAWAGGPRTQYLTQIVSS